MDLEDLAETPRPETPTSMRQVASVSSSSSSGILHTIAVGESETARGAPCGRITRLPLDDLVFSVFVGRDSLVFGTIYGRVVEYSFGGGGSVAPRSGAGASESASLSTERFVTCRSEHMEGSGFRMLQAFSEDAVRCVYKKEDKIWAVVGNHAWYEFGAPDVASSVLPNKFDRRISAQIKYVLQDGSRVLIPSLGVTIMHDFDTAQTWLSPLRLPDSDVVPLDFRDDCLLSFVHPTKAMPAALKVLRLPFTIDEPKWGTTVDCIFHQELPKAVTGLTLARFWGPGRIVFVANCNHMYVFEVATGNRLAHWKTGAHDIVILDATDLNRVVTVDVTARLRTWRLSSPLNYTHEQRLPSQFRLNQVYVSQQRGSTLYYSADAELAFVTIFD